MLECARIEELKLEQQQQAKEMILTRRTAVAKVKVHSSVQDQPYEYGMYLLPYVDRRCSSYRTDRDLQSYSIRSIVDNLFIDLISTVMLHEVPGGTV